EVPVNDARVSPDGRWMACAGDDGFVWLRAIKYSATAPARQQGGRLGADVGEDEEDDSDWEDVLDEDEQEEDSQEVHDDLTPRHWLFEPPVRLQFGGYRAGTVVAS
ncbi:hypothetical protein HK104_000244, partial [Borealophlyctis nickersoniae]